MLNLVLRSAVGMATISQVEHLYRTHLSLLVLATIVSFHFDGMRRSEQPLGLRGSRCGLSHGPVTVWQYWFSVEFLGQQAAESLASDCSIRKYFHLDQNIPLHGTVVVRCVEESSLLFTLQETRSANLAPR